MYIDYKIKHVSRNDVKTEIDAIMYEGEYKDVTFIDIDNEKKTVNMYVRNKELRKDHYEISEVLDDEGIMSFLNNRIKAMREAEYSAYSILYL